MASLQWQVLGDVQIAEADLSCWTEADLPLEALSAEELRHCNRLVDAEERRSYARRKIFQRLFVRRVSGHSHALQEVPLLHARDSRPFYAEDRGLCLSFSSSGDRAVAACSRLYDVGIDVERQRPVPEAPALARRFFTTSEADEVRLRPEAVQSQAFLLFWSAKEACLKAHGTGVIGGLQSFEFSLAGETIALKKAPALLEGRNWQIRRIAVAEGYLATLATAQRA